VRDKDNSLKMFLVKYASDTPVSVARVPNRAPNRHKQEVCETLVPYAGLSARRLVGQRRTKIRKASSPTNT